MKKKTNNTSNMIMTIISIILLITSLILFSYPILSNHLTGKNQTKAIEKYEEELDSPNSEIDVEKELEKAQKYNDNIAGDPVHDPFISGSGYALSQDYLEIININGIMGYIEIPKISIKLPIYHGTSEEVLEKGVGHIESTAIPIGGKTVHSVLTGHRGLPSARLFTDLDKLNKGDYIYIHILDRTLTYKVYEIEVIEPTQMQNLQLIPNRDLITLVTCTPYGVNTHRLLVHTERVKDEELKKPIENQEKIEKSENYDILILIFGILIAVIEIIVQYIVSLHQRKRRE